MKKHPDAKLTMRQAFEKHYDKSELGEETVKGYRNEIRHWERLTTNPPIGKITDATLADFRQAMIDAAFSPDTINGVLGRFRSIFRRVGPRVTGNPRGLNIIEQIPAYRLIRHSRRRPHRVSLEELSAVYEAAENAVAPTAAADPCAWWRAMLVLAATSALRRGDLFDIRWSQIDFENRTIDFTARKTGKADLFPLHPVAVEHLRAIQGPADCRVFQGMFNNGRGNFYKRFRTMQKRAGVQRLFSLHDLRRTAASWIEAIRPGLGKELLQHAPRTVWDISYLNKFDELQDAIGKMKLPAAFVGKREKRRPLPPAAGTAAPPMQHNPKDWKFQDGAFAYRGRWFPILRADLLRAIRLLAQSPVPVTLQQLADTMQRRVDRVKYAMHALRKMIRGLLKLPRGVDPVPCVSRGFGGAWTIWIP